MARIRTIKPEFWSHPVLGKRDDATKLMALALLNYADDEGYFIAELCLVRNFCRPFDEDLTNVRRLLNDLSILGYISICENSDQGTFVGKIENFAKHQKIDRPSPSKIKPYFDSTKLRRTFDDHSLPEQGTGNREQGSGKGSEGSKKSPPSASGKNDFIDKIVYAFANEYVIEFNSEYVFLNKGKERAGAAKILQLYKQKYPEATSEESLQGLREYFALCMKVPDNWLRTNMSLATLVSKFNTINKLIKNGRQDSKGATTEQLTNIVAKHFST